MLDSARWSSGVPQPLDSFVGRERELATLGSLLLAHRVVTVYGPGGVGKSRLAAEVANRATGLGQGGVVFAQLGPSAGPGMLAQVVAAALGAGDQTGADVTATVAASLRGRDTLLVLDNCEHVVDACARFAETVLRECARLRLLITSREVMRIPGEVAFRLDPLELAPPAARGAYAVDSPAVRLFVERARSSRPGFALTEDNAALVASICEQLDGLPLAIELAAHWVRLLGLPEIISRLADRFALLNLPARTGTGRGSNLHAAIENSYLLLTSAEQAAFRRLAVLAGGFGVAAASAVCAEGGEPVPGTAMLAVLASLESKSLVVPVSSAAGTRFRQLESVRLYAEERLVAAGELQACRQRMVGWLHCIACGIRNPHRSGEPGAPLGEEERNLRVGMSWAQQWDDERQLDLAVVLAAIWRATGDGARGRGLLAEMIERGIGRPRGRVFALVTAAGLAVDDTDYAAAARLAGSAVGLARPLGEPTAAAAALNVLGVALTNLADFAAARAYLEESSDLLRQAGDHAGAALSLHDLAHCLMADGQLEEAAVLLAEAEPMVRQHASTEALGEFLHALGALALLRGALAEAESTFAEVLRWYAKDRGIPDTVLASSLEGLALVSARAGRPATAQRRVLRLAGAAAAVRERLGSQPGRQWRSQVTEAVSLSRATAHDADRWWAEGKRWTQQQAVSCALGGLEMEAAEPGGAAVLTDREREVVGLIAVGATNPEIARHLTISTRTVDTHVDHIRAKLGVRSRVQIAVWAAQQLPAPSP